jgi:phosphomannomutase/phosphoglucomutase
MHVQEAIIGGEISGHMFFNEEYYGYDDAFLAALKMLGILSKSTDKFSSFFNGLHPIFNTPEIRMECADSEKFGLIAEVTKAFQDQGLKVLTIDGAMVEIDEWTWGAIRASNTAPQLTLRFESDTEEKLQQVMDVFHDVLKDFKQVDASKIKR